MFKKPTKKQFLIRRIVLSAVATLSVLIIVTVTILFMLGFRLDSGNGRLEQGALLQFDSTPGGVDVYVDDKNIGRTANKSTVIAGVHTIRMQRTGYEQWNRTIDLSAGTLTWLDYIRMVPTNRPVTPVTTYASLVSMEISPDAKWALAHEKADSPVFQLIDLRAEAVKSTALTIPAKSYTDASTAGVTHSFALAKWDGGGRYALVKHLYGEKTEWIVLDTQDSNQTVNVTQLLSVDFKDLQFAGTNGKAFYGLTTDGVIRKIDTSAATISRGLVTHAETFTVFNNTIISYVGVDPSDATKRVAGVYRDGDEAPHILRTVATPDVSLKIATGRYFSDDYVAIAEGGAVTILKGTYPNSSSQDNSSLVKFTELSLDGPVTALSFSPAGDYVVAQANTSFVSFELEHRRSAVGAVAVADGKQATAMRWLDGAHLWNDDNNALIMRDFNGINVHSIMTVESGYDASLSQNGRYFYAVGKTDKGYHLQRVTMILE